MNFNPLDQAYPSRRSLVFGRAMAASSNPLTSQLGLDILKKGGNAIDAALAMAAGMTLLEPTCNGLGSDLFAIIYYQGRLYGLNASGPSPKAASYKFYKDKGYQAMPDYGPLSINVPGAVDGWLKLSARFGTFSLEEVFQGVISYAKEGYPVSPIVSKLWEMEFSKYERLDFDTRSLFKTFGLNGRAPRAGEVFKNEALGQSLQRIAKDGRRFFYEGDLAKASCSYVKDQGGILDLEDFNHYQAQWVDPISTNYRGYDVFEMPPNGHGISVLMALSILDRTPYREDLETLHRQIEATKLSMTLARAYVCDPDYLLKTPKDLLAPGFIKAQEARLGPRAQDLSSYQSEPSTVYLTTADQEGNMVSLIQSNYDGFGSGLVQEDYSISFNNRAANFCMEETHPNCIGSRKRSYHTIIPGFIMKDGRAYGTFGVMGAFMQPQGHIQVLSNLFDQGLNPQAALDKPRWQWVGENRLEVERDFDPRLCKGLKDLGHDITVAKDFYSFGRGQVILQMDNGIYAGGTEKRTDGHIACY